MERTTYNDLPERMDYLISEISELKNILVQRKEKKEEVPKFLDKKQALRYMMDMGFIMSESKLYKMTSQNCIPYHKSGSKLYFIPDELERWVDEQIEGKKEVSHNFPIENEMKIQRKKVIQLIKK
jgi:hypothetical protein